LSIRLPPSSTLFPTRRSSDLQFTNVFIAATNAVPILTNDVIWICTNTAWTIVGSNALRSAGEALFATQRRAPLSLRVSTSGVNSDRKSTRLNSSHDQISYAVF